MQLRGPALLGPAGQTEEATSPSCEDPGSSQEGPWAVVTGVARGDADGSWKKVWVSAEGSRFRGPKCGSRTWKL